MEIPVTGLVFHNDGSDFDHSHGLYILSWDGRPVHVHPFSGATSFDAGHLHHYAGQTKPAPSGVAHVHEYDTVTSFDVGHHHNVRGTTGPAIPLPSGGHYHYFQGYTTVNGAYPHSHTYSGNTGNERSG